MQEVNIKGKTFTEEEVCAYGAKSIKKTRKVLMIIGLSLIAACVFVVFAAFFAAFNSPIVDSETGETIIVTFSDALIVSITYFVVFAIPGAILLVLSFLKAKKAPYPAGIKYLNKHFPYPLGADGQIAEILQGDKLIQLSNSPDIALIISSYNHKFQIRKNKKYSKIFNREQVIDFEIKVDNEVVITSKSQTNKGFGKAVVGGVLFGGAGAIAGAIAGNKKTDTSQSQREIHHYTLVLKINDIHTPSLVVELPSLQLAEEVATTLAILCQDSSPVAESSNSVEPPQVAKKPNTDNTETAKNDDKMDKFEEIKKYKELLDMGIISQEEFEIEKTRILK